MVKLGSYSSFGLIRPLSDGRVKLEWKPKFIAVESGILLWYLDEMSVRAEGAVGIMRAPEVLSTPLTTGERVIRINQGKDQAGNVIQLEFAVHAEEVGIWESVLLRHVAVSTEYDSLGQIHSGRSLEEEMAAMVWDEEESDMTISVHVNGEQFPLHISPKETDMNLRSIEFVEEHGLKGVIAPKVEMELLRAQNKLFAEREQLFRKHLGKNHRKLHGVVIAEAHAALAENCAAVLSSSLKQVKEEVVPKLQEAISELKANLLEKEALYEEEKRLREDDKAEWDLGNALHVQNFEALKRDLDKTKDDAEIVKKERDRYHQTILKESKQPREMGKERERGGEADDSMSPSTFPSDTGAYSAQHPFTQERMHGEIVELRKEKRELTQALKDAHNKTKILQYELSDAYGQKSLQRKAVAGSSSSTSLLDLDEIKLKYYSAREQTVLQRQQITSFEVKNTALEKKVERLEAKVEGLEEAKKALFQEYQFDKEQLHLLRSTASVNNASNLLKESRNLREQLLKFRGEGVRLQLRIDELLQRTRTALEDLSVEAGVQINVAAVMGAITASSDVSGGPVAAPAPAMESVEPSSSSYDETKSSSFDAPLPSSSPSPKKLPFTEEALPHHTASSQLSPLIEERMMKLCFHRYLPSESTPVQGAPKISMLSQRGVRAAMTMQRFLRFAKDFNMCYIGSPGSGGPCHPPFLSPGEVEMIFVNSARSDGEHHEEEKLTKKPFAYRGGAGTDKMYSKDYKHGQSTGLTINFQQFRKALLELACALYGDLVLEETGAELDCLPKQQRSKAALAVFDVLFKKKLLPICGKLSLVPWSLIYVNQTIAILEEYPAVSYYITDNIIGEMLQWYHFYAASASGSNSGGISYKKISKFAHDFGMIPFVLNEPSLYSMYQEILLWVRRMGDVVERCTPDGVEDADPDLGCSKKSSSVAKKDYNTKVLNHLELPEPANTEDRISFRDFVLLFASISTLAFNDASPETRLSKLFDVAKVSGGHVMISRTSAST